MKNTLTKFVQCWVFTGLLFVGTFSALAHNDPNSYITLTSVSDQEIAAEILVPVFALQETLGYNPTETVLPPVLAKYIENRVLLTSDGNRWNVELLSTGLNKDFTEYVELQYVFTTDKYFVRSVDLFYNLVLTENPAHSANVYINDESGESRQVAILKIDQETNIVPTVTIELESDKQIRFTDAMSVGFNHFRYGYDHILFLVTILLIAPFVVNGKRWTRLSTLRSVVWHIVTISISFTLGHSVSLLLGSFINVLPYTTYIEITIALTILISALHAVRPLFGRAEVVIIGLFGVVHGLAFASELGLASINVMERLQVVFAFNLGLEVFQLIVITLALPVYLLVLRYDTMSYTRSILSGVAVVAAITWLIERIGLQHLS
jgi:hypothetical protein